MRRFQELLKREEKPKDTDAEIDFGKIPGVQDEPIFANAIDERNKKLADFFNKSVAAVKRNDR